MALAVPTSPGGGQCPVCAGDCAPAPDIDHLASYPFLPGGRDPMADQDHVIATERVVDHDLGRVVYGAGDRVPMDDAVKYGLVSKAAAKKAPAKKATKASKRARKGLAEDRARKKGEDR